MDETATPSAVDETGSDGKPPEETFFSRVRPLRSGPAVPVLTGAAVTAIGLFAIRREAGRRPARGDI